MGGRGPDPRDVGGQVSIAKVSPLTPRAQLDPSLSLGDQFARWTSKSIA